VVVRCGERWSRCSLDLRAHGPREVAVDRWVREVERGARVVVEYPREDGVLVEVVVCATSELVEAHEIAKVGELATVPCLLWWPPPGAGEAMDAMDAMGYDGRR
jgi:hypothetical protein